MRDHAGIKESACLMERTLFRGVQKFRVRNQIRKQRHGLLCLCVFTAIAQDCVRKKRFATKLWPVRVLYCPPIVVNRNAILFGRLLPRGENVPRRFI
jgi:hypothetical protein